MKTTAQINAELAQAEKDRRRRRVEVHQYNAAGPVPNKKHDCPRKGHRQDWRKEWQ